MPGFIARSASVADTANVDPNSSIWEFSQVRENVWVGENSIIGSHVYLDKNVKIGKNCKIQNGAMIYNPAIIHDGVFIGPGVILTNDKYPRAVDLNEKLKLTEDWVQVGVEILEGASIGAGSVCIAPVKIGKWAVIGAGSVVTKDVQDHSLVVGNPAMRIGWVGKAGVKLNEISEGLFQCPSTFTKYEVRDSKLLQV